MLFLLATFTLVSLISYGQNYISTKPTAGSGNIYHTNGFLGIGTINPQTMFHLQANHNNTSYFPTIRLQNIYPKSELENYWDISNHESLIFSFSADNLSSQTMLLIDADGRLVLGVEDVDNSAIFQAESSTMGILIPRMTTVEKTAINLPANGLMVYDTDTESLSIFNNTNENWEHITKQTELAEYLLASDFNNTIAAQLTETDTANWNATYLWGNHADAGYITDGNTNWENTYDFITASTNDELTNKTGNISMWNNDAGYLTEENITSPWQESYKHVYRISGRVGVGTDSPQKALHLFNFNKKGLPPENPTLRLELHGSSNISPNHTVWDIKSSGTRLDFMYAEVKANESTIPTTKFRISKSGTVTATKFVGDGSGFTNLNWQKNGNNIYYNDGNVGIGTEIPILPLHIKREVNDLSMGYDASGIILETALENSNTSTKWKINNDGMHLSFQTKYGTLNEYLPMANFTTSGLILKKRLTVWETTKSNVIFKVDGTSLSYDNAFYVDNSSTFVGLGTLLPNAKLHVNNGSILITENNEELKIQVANTDVKIGSSAGNISFWHAESGYNTIKCDKLWVLDDVAVQTTNPWPDYVFAPSYKLMPLNELETYIKKHKHLPNMPSATDVTNNGQKLAENQILILEKVEELTLYIIELKKENEDLKLQISNLKNN